MSLSSITTVSFPWKNKPVRPPPVDQSQVGRGVDPAGYYLCMNAVMLLTTGLGICGFIFWTIMYMLPLLCVSGNMVLLGASVLSLCAGIVNLPSGWLAVASHDNKKNYVFLPLLIVLLGFSIIILIVNASLVFIYKSQIRFEYESHQLLPGQYRKALNLTLFDSLINCEDHQQCQLWNRIQQRLKCCGVMEKSDWISTGKELPPSCCISGICNKKTEFKHGCLDKIAFEFKRQTTLITGLSLIIFSVQMFSLCIAGYMYLVRRLENRRSGIGTNVVLSGSK